MMKIDIPAMFASRAAVKNRVSGAGLNLEALKKIYGEVRAHDLLLQAVYFVKIENVFNHKVDAPWFTDESLCYLATEAPLSFGSSESESFYAGSHQCGYLTQRTSSDISITFMETTGAHIAKSYVACRALAFNDDGTINEPRKYAFKLTIGFLDPKDITKSPLRNSFIVAAQNITTEASSAGRSEVVKHSIDFLRLRPTYLSY